MSEQHTLRQKARQAIRDRKMPRRYPERLWGGPGTGARCAICDEPMGPDDIEFELEFPRSDDHPGQGNPHVHTRCFSEWEVACRDLQQAPATRRTRPEKPLPARHGVWRGSS